MEQISLWNNAHLSTIKKTENMKKVTLTCILTVLVFSATFAQRYLTKTGHIWFHSEAPLETIEAHNHQVNAVLDTKSGAIVFKVLMKSFVFKKALMQEHFNENYVESNKYPNATFRGKVTNIEEIDFKKAGTSAANIEGELSIHGVTKPVKATGTFAVQKGTVHGTSVFTIKIADYNISIPGAAAGKIAEKVDVHVDVILKELKK